MKDTKNNERSRWMVAVGFMAALYIFWRYAYPCALAYHEQMQLFLWNGDYLMDRLAEPGGVARYLAETELVSGHDQLARKYLYILHDATFYRQWAEDVLPLTRSVKLLDAHPLYGPLSHSFPEKDVMS